MSRQLRQCFATAKPFQLKKARKSLILSGFMFPKKAKGVQKKPEFPDRASKRPNWQP